METLKAAIEKADDDYLAGLGNKGILKRAYKDLEQESPVLTWKGQEAQVDLKEVSCVLKTPLGESTCSCPSRSMCRHIITAILWMKREGRGEEVRKEEKGQEKEGVQEGPPSFEELLQIAPQRMKRACRGRHYREFLAQMRTCIQTGEPVPVQESSVVTVELSWEKAVVKLLLPFEYSTCTCHSRELCVHKAQAVLAYQLQKGRLTLKDLEELQEQENPLDEAMLRQACSRICEDLCHQMCIGLSRQSPEEAESLQRLALIAHRAGLPELESVLREASACYQQYFSRSAAFRCEELFTKLLWAYRQAKKLMKEKDQERMRLLAGTFRDAYEPAGRLHLVGMGGRSFASKSGYEGEIYYFLETVQKRWYTWTDVRPVIYEGVKAGRSAKADNLQAPWELNCSREQMQELEFDLLNARAASGGRLSSSKESKAEITGSRNMDAEEISRMIRWNYEELIRDDPEPGRERLALVGTCRWGEALFDSVEQRFSWSIYDREGRELLLSLQYTEKEKLTIGLLERLEHRLQGQSGKAMVFLGSIYTNNGQLCLYPIEVFFREKEENSFSEKTEMPDQKEEELPLPDRKVLDTMEQYIKEAAQGLTDLFTSGLYSAQEETLAELLRLSAEGERFGLHQAGKKLARISGLMQEKWHRMEFSPEPVIDEAAELERYLSFCQRKINCDQVRAGWREKV